MGRVRRSPLVVASERATLVLILCIISALGTISHSAYYLRFRDFYVRDSSSYITPAASFVRGDGFLNATDQTDTRRTPGYPLLIALFLRGGGDLKYLIVLQHAMAVALAIGVTAFTWRMTGRWFDSAVAGTVLNLDLATLNAANSI